MKTSLRLGFAVLITICVSTPTFAAERLFGLTTDNSIIVFDSATPSVAAGGGMVTGLAANENLIGIDYQPASGNVVLIGSQSNVYTLDSTAGVSFNATQLGSTLSPALDGSNFAFDFNPAFMGGQFARIISNLDDNNVISGFTGAYLGGPKTDVFYASGDANDGANPNIAGIAYDRSDVGSTATQQYGIDATLGVVTTVANNAGTLETVGSLGITGPISDELGFDISGATETAFAAIQTGNSSQLFTVDLSTGAATSVGMIGDGSAIRSLTTVPVPEPKAGATVLVLAAAVAMRFRRRRR